MKESVENALLPQLYKIQRHIKETHDTFTLELKPLNGTKPKPFFPGQFNMLYVFGVGEVPISISGDPASPEIMVHTVRAVGVVTKAMRVLKNQSLIGVRGPYGSYWPVDEAQGNDILIVAGGIGLAPLRPAVYRILAQREKFGKVVLLYGTRTPGDILYRKELERWRARFDMEVMVTVDFAPESWRSNVGVVTHLISRAHFDPLNTVALICGPEIMIRYTIMELKKRNMADEDIYISMERNMKCGVGFCGHCQFGPTFICKDGPVFSYDKIKDWFGKREI